MDCNEEEGLYFFEDLEQVNHRAAKIKAVSYHLPMQQQVTPQDIK